MDIRAQHKSAELRFWGVRGSVPAPGPETVAIGGNTICVSVQYGEYFIVFDAGTGIRRLGAHVESFQRRSWEGAILLTHYHWDHIQGLPFFTPAFNPTNRFEVFGESKDGANVREILETQMCPPYFPLPLDDMQGLIGSRPPDLAGKHPATRDVNVQTVRLNHPNGAIGYRLDTPEFSTSFITDHEHPTNSLDQDIIEFVQGSTILIHDAQYTPEEKEGPKAGWGHSSWRDAALTAKEANVQRLYLIHHDPSRTDRQIFGIQRNARAYFEENHAATESTVVDLIELSSVAGA